MTLVKYAVRVPFEGRRLYRSASSSWHVTGWDDAQLWANAKTAEKEAKRLRDKPDRISRWSGDMRARVDTSDAQVVAINIGEPL